MKKHYGFIHNDPDTIVELDKVQVPRKAMQGTPWYQVLSNQKYAQQFFYIGAFVEEREKLIEDGFRSLEEEQYEKEQNSYKYEQSDMVMILLNLAYIPDSVILNIKDFEPGWQRKFKQAMNDHKEAFNQKVAKRESGSHGQAYDTKWKYQNEALEDRYAKFVKKRVNQQLLKLTKSMEESKKKEMLKNYPGTPKTPKNIYQNGL